MHLCDGTKSNFEISKIANLDIDIINEAIQLFISHKLIKVKR